MVYKQPEWHESWHDSCTRMEPEECEKWGRPGNTYHVNDMWWTQGGRKVDVGRGSPHSNNVIDFECSNSSQDPNIHKIDSSQLHW